MQSPADGHRDGSPPRQENGAGGSRSASPNAAAIVAWRQAVHDALAPVLGSRGVAALVQRSVHLATVEHPFLGGADTVSPDPDFAALHALLIRQRESEIAAAGATLAKNLSSLLEGLVGPSLTQRLLHKAQTQSTGGSPAQDESR